MHNNNKEINTLTLPSQHPRRLRRIAAVAAVSNSLSKCASTAVDVSLSAGRLFQRAAQARQASILLTELPSTVQPLLRKLPFQLLKSVPTKTLTVIFFELACRSLTKNSRNRQHDIPITVACGASAVLSTYPFHFIEYASRSKQAFSLLGKTVQRNPAIIYAGLIPAIIAYVPVMYTDYAIFKRIRATYEQAHPNYLAEARNIAVTVAVAGALTKVIGTAIGEPFSIISRKVAMDALRAQAKGPASISASQIALSIAHKGIGSFWSGFPKKSVSTAIAAIVSKQSQHTLRRVAVPKKFISMPVLNHITGRKTKHPHSKYIQFSC